MRRKIRLDCTGDPPGELITTATAGNFDIVNARSIAPAAVVSDSPGRSGVTMPMGPDSLNTGTTGARLKGHIDCKSSKDGRLTVRWGRMPETATRSPSAAHSCLWLGVCGENGAGRRQSRALPDVGPSILKE